MVMFVQNTGKRMPCQFVGAASSKITNCWHLQTFPGCSQCHFHGMKEAVVIATDTNREITLMECHGKVDCQLRCLFSNGALIFAEVILCVHILTRTYLNHCAKRRGFRSRISMTHTSQYITTWNTRQTKKSVKVFEKFSELEQ